LVAAAALLASWLSMSAAIEVPAIEHPVTDLAGVLSPAEEESIARELVEHRAATGVQLAVLVLDSTHPDDIADFAQRVFTAWGGGSAERDDGALFVLAIADRRSRLHLGYGLEPVVPDAAAQRMLDALRPSLQDSRYADATHALVSDFRTRTAHLQPGGPLALPLGAIPWLWLVVLAIGLAAGVAWGIVFRRGLAAYAREAGTTRSAHRRLPWTTRARLALAGVLRRREVRIVGGVIAGAQLLVIACFFEGRGFASAYSLVLWAFVLAGWLVGGTPRPVAIPTGLAVLAALLVAMGVLDPAALHADGAAVLSAAAPALATLGIFGVVAVWTTVSVAYGEGSSSSYSSSSSSSSSSYSSSTSYSSSSYSGGGGSSGGGGASSSW
jgi:uncharacterized protein